MIRRHLDNGLCKSLARCWLAKYRNGAGLFAHSLHARFIVTPNVAVIERPLRPKVERVERFAGSDVIAEFLDQSAQRAAMTKATPPATPYRLVCENPLAAEVVDEPDLAAVIDFHAGVAVHGLTVEEPAAVVGDDPDCLVDVLNALAFQSEFVFCGHGASSPVYWLDLY